MNDHRSFKLTAGVFLIAVLSIAYGCASAPTENGIPLPVDRGVSEISLKIQTGLLGVSSTVTFQRGGTARFECSYYDLDESDKPRDENAESQCGEFYKSNPTAFVKDQKNLKGLFTGNLSNEQFNQLAQIIEKNDLFLRNEERGEVLTDAPPNVLTIVFGNKTRMIFHNAGNVNEKISEIETAIYQTAKDIKWESHRQ